MLEENIRNSSVILTFITWKELGCVYIWYSDWHLYPYLVYMLEGFIPPDSQDILSEG